MTATTRRLLRRLILALAALVAGLTLVVAVVANAPASTSMGTMRAMPHVSTHKALVFHRAMDKLWEDHIIWTRMAIVSFAAGSPDLNAAETRLLQNQTDIGNAVKPFYGKAAGAELTSMLRTHILEAVAVLEAAKAGDSTQLAAAQAAWLQNANEIAAFLHRANPNFWKLAAMRTMMHEHLKLTTEEAVARLTGDWQGDVTAFDAVHAEILRMSNMLANGIIAQFPQRFR